MMNDNVCRWIENLRPRVMQYLYYKDILEETLSKLSGLQGKQKTEFQIQVTADFFVSEFYNADFDPWPDPETRIDTIEDLTRLIENDIDRKKFENSIAYIFQEAEAAAEKEAPAPDPQRDEFFTMMAAAFGTQDLLNSIERSKTEVTEILSRPLPGEPGESEQAPEEQDVLFDEEGKESLMARLQDLLDDHMDSL